MSAIGSRVRRLEDRVLLTGRGRFAADLSFPGQLHMRMVRSPLAHGLLRAVDTSEAQAMAGVVAVLTAADIADLPVIDFRMVKVERLKLYRQPVLARDKVRYVGEPVAAVIAEDPYLAEDAAEVVFADIEELPPILRAIDPPGEFASGLETEASLIVKSYGDVEAAFARAHDVVELELEVGRHTGSPLETRGALARYDAERDLLQLFGAAKVPHHNRLAIAAMLGIEPRAIHLYEGHVGGGFGIRGELYPEDVLVCVAARRLDRPVKWIEDRREHLIAANHSRGQLHRIRAAIDARGVILGLENEFWHDQGAYVRTHAATVPDLSTAMLPGPYLIPAYRGTGHIRLTNKTPAGTYRAPGRYETTFVRERLLDEIGRRLDIGQVEVRRRNLVPPERMPLSRGIEAMGTPLVLDSGDYPLLLDRFLELVRHEELEARLAARRSAGERVGFGLGYFVEKSGLGPFEMARVELRESGDVEVIVGVASLGQGVETVMAQICADALGVPVEGITVVHGQTDRIAEGRGSFASRATAMAGPAVHIAAGALRERLVAVAAPLLQAEAADLEIEGARVHRRGGAGGPSIGLDEIARTAAQNGQLAALSVEHRFESSHMNYPYGIHGAVARVDEETGGVTIERLYIAYDVGRAINPLLIEGQLAGGAAQGLGGALLEEFLYDESAQPLSASFADYLMPTSAEMPPLEMLVTEDAPSPINPLGVKGAGEGGINAMGAAIAAAIDAALGRPGLIRRLPVTPARLRALLTRP